MSVDPLTEKYPSLSPYNYVANNPLANFDPDGRAIFRNGKEISPSQAHKLANIAVNTALSGKSAYIDFIGQKHAVKDFRRLTKTFGLFEAIIRTISGGIDPLHGYNPSTIYLGESIAVNTGLGEQSYPSMQVETTYSFDDITSFGEHQILGTSSEGEDVLGFNFNTKIGDTVIRLTGTVSELNSLLGEHGYKLEKYEAGKKNEEPYYIYRLEKTEEEQFHIQD